MIATSERRGARRPVAATRVTMDPLAWLSALVAVLAVAAAGIGLFWRGGSGPLSATSVRGETVQLFGQGIYRYDTLFQGAIFRGADAAALFAGVPLLLIALGWYRRGSPRGKLALTAMLGYFLYYYASVALSATYNNLFLVYVVLFAASLFGFVLCVRSIDAPALTSGSSSAMPRRALATFLFVAGVVTLVVWLGDVVTALLRGEPPKHLDSYTTLVTYVLDLGIITPAVFLAAFLVLRRQPLGYLMAFPLLGVIVLLAPTIVGQTVSQLAAGVELTTAEIAGPTAGFVVLGLFAIWLLVSLFRYVSESARPSAAPASPTTESISK